MGVSTRPPATFRDVVRTAFGAHWTAAGESLDAVAWNNVGFNPKNLDEYVFLNVAHASGTIASLGTGVDIQTRRTVVFAAQIFVKHNTGQARADALAEIVLDFMESAKLTGIRFRDPGLTEVGRVNEWFQVNANCTIEYDSYRSTA